MAPIPITIITGFLGSGKTSRFSPINYLSSLTKKYPPTHNHARTSFTKVTPSTDPQLDPPAPTNLQTRPPQE